MHAAGYISRQSRAHPAGMREAIARLWRSDTLRLGRRHHQQQLALVAWQRRRRHGVEGDEGLRVLRLGGVAAGQDEPRGPAAWLRMHGAARQPCGCVDLLQRRAMETRE